MKFTRLSLAKRISLVAIGIVLFLVALLRRERTILVTKPFDSISFNQVAINRKVRLSVDIHWLSKINWHNLFRNFSQEIWKRFKWWAIRKSSSTGTHFTIKRTWHSVSVDSLSSTPDVQSATASQQTTVVCSIKVTVLSFTLAIIQNKTCQLIVYLINGS